jgi:hypothetical protein
VTGAGKLVLYCRISMTMQNIPFYCMQMEYDECYQPKEEAAPTGNCMQMEYDECYQPKEEAAPTGRRPVVLWCGLMV